jgi:NAD(P)-dependent dehydrogenase (short-subunit alcohol dehydrogenase family)
MRAQGHGRIVQCSSILGLVPMRFRGAYNASKHALEGLSVTLAMELEGTNIHVSLIEPGAIDTPVPGQRPEAFPPEHRHRRLGASRGLQAQLRRLEKQERSDNAQTAARCRPQGSAPRLNAPRPRYHYTVTREARLGAIARRLLPARLFYPWLASQD